MPFYEFRCKKCETVYEERLAYDKTGKYPKVKCPSCKSKSKERLMSSTSFAFGNPVGTDKWTSHSQGHDYRFKYNLPNVRAERAAAEASHKGAMPYKPIDDINKYGEGIHDAESRGGLT